MRGSEKTDTAGLSKNRLKVGFGTVFGLEECLGEWGRRVRLEMNGVVM